MALTDDGEMLLGEARRLLQLAAPAATGRSGSPRLGTDQFPAPAAQTWSAVAIALGQGLSSLESVKLCLIFAGSVVGVLLTLAPILFPKYQEYLPSASAFGLAWVFPWYYGLLFFLGALVADQ